MKNVILAAAAALALAACQDKATVAMVKGCMNDGYEEKTCNCLAKESKATMDKDAYAAMGLIAQGKEDEANALMEKMPIDKKFSVATGIVQAMDKCSVEAH
jgi:hypothetical protein